MINDIEYAIIFAIEQGAELAKGAGPAPARIVGFSLPGNQDPDLSDDGWALFDAAIRWLDPAPQAGLVTKAAEMAGYDQAIAEGR